MKIILLVLVSFAFFAKIDAQVSIPVYRPLPNVQTTPVIMPEPAPPSNVNFNTYNSYSEDKKIQSIDFNNSTLNLYKLRHLVTRNDSSIIDSLTSVNKQFVIRTNYIIDVSKNFVWDIKKKEFDNENNMMIFYCTRDNKYGSSFGIKMDGSSLIMYWTELDKKNEYYVYY